MIPYHDENKTLRTAFVTLGLVVLPGIVFAAAALTVGFWSAIRRDIPLEAAQ